ncbi:MAG: IS110 family transposase, partial [Candidatus Sulfotelmatobacter sp.]
MARKSSQKSKGGGSRMLPVMHPDAAGVDIGAEEIFVAVPADRAADPVRSFGTFTRELHELADWLQKCGVRTVAMESTGVFWIPLYQILETRGFEVFLVNAQHVKNVPGRKSDVSDCQWIQYLHSVGLLKASFRPPDEICVIRSLWRHRESLVQMAAEHIMHMQKALSQMNLQLHHVLSQITGLSGQKILDAILAGERDPMRLASLCNGRVKSSRETVAKSLEGDYREEHLFALRQSLVGYRFYQTHRRGGSGTRTQNAQTSTRYWRPRANAASNQGMLLSACRQRTGIRSERRIVSDSGCRSDRRSWHQCDYCSHHPDGGRAGCLALPQRLGVRSMA